MTTLGPALRALASALWSVVRVLAARVAPGLSPFRSPDRCGTVRSTRGAAGTSRAGGARGQLPSQAPRPFRSSRGGHPTPEQPPPDAHTCVTPRPGHGGGCRVPFPRARRGAWPATKSTLRDARTHATAPAEPPRTLRCQMVGSSHRPPRQPGASWLKPNGPGDRNQLQKHTRDQQHTRPGPGGERQVPFPLSALRGPQAATKSTLGGARTHATGPGRTTTTNSAIPPPAESSRPTRSAGHAVNTWGARTDTTDTCEIPRNVPLQALLQLHSAPKETHTTAAHFHDRKARPDAHAHGRPRARPGPGGERQVPFPLSALRGPRAATTSTFGGARTPPPAPARTDDGQVSCTRRCRSAGRTQVDSAQKMRHSPTTACDTPTADPIPRKHGLPPTSGTH